MKRVGNQPVKNQKKTKAEDDNDPIQVYCRIRPIPPNVESSCIKVVSDTDIQIYCPPDERGVSKEGQFSYKKIFTEYETQEVVFQDLGLPLIEELLIGKSSLIFAYGISGSGKSYTMTGNQDDGGIVGRCFDVIFNSIQDYQARRCTFKPDKLNGYDILSIEDAMLLQAEDFKNNVKNLKTPKRKDGETDRIPFNYKITDLDKDIAFSVFVTYVEIYHNYVYDLLEDVSDGEIRRNSKIIREDSNGNMYVHGVNEQEVNNAGEAFEWLKKGQLRKRTAPTFLNMDSSRSHTVFTIKVVQAPLDADGVNVIQDKKYTVVSQLSLVDLAGSERAGKAKTTGQRLHEAGEINKSLSNLKQCLKILYENQSSSNLRSIAEKIPYRTSRLTHLFKSFFEGFGSIRMLICINPMSEYAELLPVLQFGEMSGSVQVKRMTPLRPDVGLTPGRKKAIDIQSVNRIPCVMEEDILRTPMDNKINYDHKENYFSLCLDLGPPLPELEVDDLLNEDKRQELITALDQRIKKKEELREILINQSNEIRSQLVFLESNYASAQQEINSLQILRDQDINKVKQYQNKAFLLENEMTSLKRKLELVDSENKRLKSDLNAKENMLNQVSVDKDLLKQKYNTKIVKKQEQLSREFKDKWRVQENEFEAKLQEKKRKLKHIKNIVESTESIPNHFSRRVVKRTLSDDSLSKPSEPTVNNSKPVDSKSHEPSQATLRYLRSRRSKSCDPQERWIEHKPPAPIPLQTVMQPKMKKRKSITKLTDAKTVSNTNASKYCLLTQGSDEQGVPEAKLYKADIIQTMGGGAQIVFNDVETLKQDSPLGGSPVKNRIQAYNNEIKAQGGGSNDIREKCYGIQGGYTPISRK